MEENIKRKLGNYEQLFKAREIIFDGGKGGGMRAVELDNSLIRCCILKDRCLDIFDLSYLGENISFISKNGLVKEPYNFNRTFGGGFLHTCGLDSIGANEGHAQHGDLHFIPAEEVYVDKESGRVSGKMRDSELFGRNLLFKRAISLPALSDKLIIEDEIINEGYTDYPYALLYHFNFGYPFVDENTAIEGEMECTVGADSYAEERKARALFGEKPVDGGREEVYYHKIKKGEVTIKNLCSKKGARINFDVNVLPCLIEWKSMISGDYAFGIEPSTSYLFDKLKYKTLKAQEKITNRIEIEFFKF